MRLPLGLLRAHFHGNASNSIVSCLGMERVEIDSSLECPESSRYTDGIEIILNYECEKCDDPKTGNGSIYGGFRFYNTYANTTVKGCIDCSTQLYFNNLKRLSKMLPVIPNAGLDTQCDYIGHRRNQKTTDTIPKSSTRLRCLIAAVAVISLSIITVIFTHKRVNAIRSIAGGVPT